jgi:hypothetical protein
MNRLVINNLYLFQISKISNLFVESLYCAKSGHGVTVAVVENPLTRPK